jgi:beta-phosphoglucomutase-like phosphatase (HAD superfamily)
MLQFHKRLYNHFMKNYNYILLDWDGCLAKTLDIWLQAYKDTFAEYGVYPDEKYITHEVFVNWDGMTKLVPDKEEYIKKLVKDSK